MAHHTYAFCARFRLFSRCNISFTACRTRHSAPGPRPVCSTLGTEDCKELGAHMSTGWLARTSARALRRGLTLVLIASGGCGVVLPAVSSGAYLAPPSRALELARAAKACPPAELLAVRGSGEHSGFGPTLWSLSTHLRKLVPHADARAVEYPAVDVRPLNPKYNSDYIDSVTRGQDALEKAVATFASGPCAKRSRLFLAGYSQGAEVVDDVFQALPTRPRQLVDGVALFGDPRFDPAQALPVDVGTFNHSHGGVAPYQFHPAIGTFGTLVSYAALDAPAVRSYCANHDQICNYSSPAALLGCAVSCAHFHYMDLHVSAARGAPTYTQAAAAFLAARLHSPVGPPPRGGAGTVSANGKVGPLTIDRSGRGAVIAFAGRADTEVVDSYAGGPAYDAIGYGCVGHERTTLAPVGRLYCRTAFYVDVASGSLEQFFTTSRLYHDQHGVTVGMSSATASRRTHRTAITGCSEGIYLRTRNATLVIGMSGGRPGKPNGAGALPLLGGHVELLALDSHLRSPGVFDCI